MKDENKEPKYEAVNMPKHYKFGKVESIDICEHLSFNRGNAVKYLCRAGRKPGADELEDLKKAEFLIRREIGKLEDERG